MTANSKPLTETYYPVQPLRSYIGCQGEIEEVTNYPQPIHFSYVRIEKEKINQGGMNGCCS